MNLPEEVVVEILTKLQHPDIGNCRSVSKKFRGIVTRNAKYLPRKPISVKIFKGNGETYICNSERGKTERFDNFDWGKWNTVAVENLTFKNISADNHQACHILQKVILGLKKTRQYKIRTFVMDSVNVCCLSNSHISEIFRLVATSCEKILISHCDIPTAFSPEQLFHNRELTHYRWLDCGTASVSNTNDAVLKRFTIDIKECATMKSFHGEMDCTTVSTVCDFIEAWSISVTAPYFNITLSGCDKTWRSSFNEECSRRNISNVCMEFASNALKSAHIKVVFVEEAQLCRMWPIFDLPARNAPGICYSRYYRDF
ncbi:hypothetical protein RB195_021453 [Necator americanus]|uniref:F-box domain-containing protein n=1 Tax=Necator americanus TaxID=51031 RepID=A0ABR1EB34_NECAM